MKRVHWNWLLLAGAMTVVGGCAQKADQLRGHSAGRSQDYAQELGGGNNATPEGDPASQKSQLPSEDGTVKGKEDRPTETGWGIPGYLIDPTRVRVEARETGLRVAGSAGAIRNEATPVSAKLDVIVAAQSEITIDAGFFKVAGKTQMTVNSKSDGSFEFEVPATAGRQIFLSFWDAGHPGGFISSYISGTTKAIALSKDGAQALNGTGITNVQANQGIVPVQKTQELTNNVLRLIQTNACQNCIMTGADLSGLSFVNCNLSFNPMEDVKAVRTKLQGCNLTNTAVVRGDFTGADLRGVNFTNADIAGAIFTGAQVEGVAGKTITP